MNVGRVLGGLLATIGGLCILIQCIIVVEGVFASGIIQIIVAWIINLLIGLLALIGGVQGLASRRGGEIAIVAGIASLILGLLSFAVTTLSVIFFQYSLLGYRWSGITLEAILIIIGAIIMLLSESYHHHHHRHND